VQFLVSENENMRHSPREQALLILCLFLPSIAATDCGGSAPVFRRVNKNLRPCVAKQNIKWALFLLATQVPLAGLPLLSLQRCEKRAIGSMASRYQNRVSEEKKPHPKKRGELFAWGTLFSQLDHRAL
jgi:hypothetical protein